MEGGRGYGGLHEKRRAHERLALEFKCSEANEAIQGPISWRPTTVK